MLKILVVEDEPKVASFIKKGLEENYYKADLAYDGIMAEKMALQNNYDLYILDIIIPFVNGLELCKSLKNLNHCTCNSSYSTWNNGRQT